MPLAPIVLRPGFNKQFTPLLNEGGYSDGNLVRFGDGLLEKFKGWVNVAIGKTFTGICRALLAWPQADGKKNAALGTHLKLQIFQGGDYYDITPVDASGTLANNPFATMSGSAIVTVTHTAHGRSVADRVIYSGAAAFNGVTIAGEYPVASVIDPNTYTIVHSVAASGTGSGGGAAVAFTYLLPSGMADAAPGFGWGAGTWGEGTWGTPRTTAIGTLAPRIWSLDLVGEDLLACPRDGKIYTWDASAGLGSRATALAGAPTINKAVLMSAPERHVVALGAEIASVFDPMLVRWSDTEIFTVFDATATNAAGSWRLSSGSEIMGGVRTKGEHLIWTDIVFAVMRWQGSPFVFRFDEYGPGSGLISPNGYVSHNGVTYWMAPKAFYRHRGGTPEEIPCPIWDEVFGDLNREQRFKITCGVNPSENEVIWRYCSAGSIEIDRYAVFNWAIGIMYGGTGMPRTAWHDGEVFGFPIATHPSNGRMYYHESGEDDDGAAMSWFAESGDVDLDEGDYFVATDDVIPDFKLDDGGAVLLSLKFRDAPNGPQTVKGPASVTGSTKITTIRGRGRQMALRLEGNSLGMSFRTGRPRLRVRRDGRQ